MRFSLGVPLTKNAKFVKLGVTALKIYSVKEKGAGVTVKSLQFPKNPTFRTTSQTSKYNLPKLKIMDKCFKD